MDFKRDEEGNIKVVEKKTTDEKCPNCGKEMVVKRGRYGEFLGCSGYPQCKTIKNIGLGVKCPLCGTGDVVQKRSAKTGIFYSCSNYPDCKYITRNKPVPTKCTECENPFIEEIYSKDSGTTKLICPKCKKEYY